MTQDPLYPRQRPRHHEWVGRAHPISHRGSAGTLASGPGSPLSNVHVGLPSHSPLLRARTNRRLGPRSGDERNSVIHPLGVGGHVPSALRGQRTALGLRSATEKEWRTSRRKKEQAAPGARASTTFQRDPPPFRPRAIEVLAEYVGQADCNYYEGHLG